MNQILPHCQVLLIILNTFITVSRVGTPQSNDMAAARRPQPDLYTRASSYKFCYHVYIPAIRPTQPPI
jgi:hypothetical protein